ncbi:hypothetical protein PsorP6_006692 [Peronosclerospora sorghi]|uniref:Uncharacterized protein n=1 Tax=Peronosclerospora sorghi TaxID=230839 RepID=A0ACC0W0R0_9STRA|nr:hypothetical protein PsorP6_006692 [Peronosclerospora sorghi]
MRRKMGGKGKPQEAAQASGTFSGEKMIVFVNGGATYSELRSMYELRTEEKRDVFMGSTSMLVPQTFLQYLETLKEDKPFTSSPSATSVSHIFVEERR